MKRHYVFTITALVVLLSSRADANTLYVADNASGTIYQYTPTGTRTVFASGFAAGGLDSGIAFNLFRV
jgi:hypothetical protein